MIPNIRTNFCPNCEAQANTIEELRAANERWVIAFKQAEERANGRIEALQARVAFLEDEIWWL
jgi:polyhydroxyalkanoate synthesis regulator phasin